MVFIKPDLPKFPDFDGMIPKPRSFWRQRKAYDAAARGDFSITHSLYQLFLRRLDWKRQSWSCRTVHLEIFKQIREVYIYICTYIYISLTETMKPFPGDWMPRVYIYIIKNRLFFMYIHLHVTNLLRRSFQLHSNFWEVYGA